MIDSTHDNLAFRNKYPEFVFDSFEYELGMTGLHVTYTYTLGEHTFKPTVEIPLANAEESDFNEDYLKYLLFNFGVINAINYYKLTCAPKFVIKAGFLDEDQRVFFKKLFFYGLGEFLYINNLPFTYEEFLTIECPNSEGKKAPHFQIEGKFSGNLIPVGGGKDSAVTLEALQSMHDENTCFQYNRDLYPDNAAALACIKAAGYRVDDIAAFNLSIDPLLLELNKEGYYNGHVPFSSGLAFASYIVAYLKHKAFIVLSNEASANEGNVAGTHINHQYSKSFEFECDFQSYCSRYFGDHIYYFSLLRCLNEYGIIQRFLKHNIYLKIFRSCNVGTKENKWCGHCAKCLYVYIMLRPFVTPDKLKEIFGGDLLDDKTLYNIFIGLINPDTTKPFECVGTREEINYALKLSIEQAQANQEPLPALLDWYKQNFYNPYYGQNVPNYYNPEHHIPENYLQLIMNL